MSDALAAAPLAQPSAAALPAGCVQAVPPAGAGRETRWVLVAVALVAVLAAGVVAWQRSMQPQLALQSHQIDLATGLSAAEQGIYTDLQAVHDEWRATGRSLPPPQPQWWAEEGWPPFGADLTAQRRGDRQWQHIQAEGVHAYLGVPDAAQAADDTAGKPARAMLWRLPNAQDAQGAFNVWIHAGQDGAGRSAPQVHGLHDEDLIAYGWRLVAAHLGDIQPKKH